MTASSANQSAWRQARQAALAWGAGWWQVAHLGALTLALALSRATYRAPNRAALARHVYLGTAPHVLPFTLLSALIGLVLIRIVVVTAQSYGLTQYALEMVVRVLVMELIPLTAAAFAALRCTLPHASELAALRAQGDGAALLEREVLPRVVAGLFCVLLLALVSCVLALLLAYLSVYGFTPWGFDGYTRTVGRVFSPAVSLVFVLKIVGFALAVSVVPVAAALEATPGPRRSGPELRGLVRMAALILLIEAGALVSNYY